MPKNKINIKCFDINIIVSLENIIGLEASPNIDFKSYEYFIEIQPEEGDCLKIQVDEEEFLKIKERVL